MTFNQLKFSQHALLRMTERNISPAEVRSIIVSGEIVEDYPTDFPFPSRLLLGWSGGKAIHVVCASDVANLVAIIITVYEPSLNEWEMISKRGSHEVCYL